MTDRLPPHSLEAERSVLGSVLMRPSIWTVVAGMLVTDAFFLPAHREVFEAMGHVERRGMPLDPITLGDELRTRGALPRLEGGEQYLMDLVHAAVIPDNYEHHARIVLGAWNKRRLIRLCAETVERAHGNIEAEELLENVAGDVSRIVMPSANDLVRIGDCVPAVLADVQKRIEVGPERAMTGRVTTGIARFDELTVGFDPGDLVIIGADPGAGKSALAVQAGLKLAIDEGGVCLCANLEMNKAQITERAIVHRARVNSFKLRRGELRNEEVADVLQAGRELVGVGLPANFYVEDKIQSVEEFEARARAVRARHPKEVTLGIFDFMQLAKTSGRMGNRAQEISEIARRLKKIAGELDMTVIGVSSLKRKQTEVSEKAPTMHDLKESGDVEYAGTTIILLWNRDRTKDGPVDLILEKNKKGPTETIQAHWIGRHYRFTDWNGDTAPPLPGTGYTND